MSVSHDHLADAQAAHGSASSHPGYWRTRVASLDLRDNQAMHIPDDRIDDFIKRWENAFDETLTREEARTKALQLIELYKMIGKRPPVDESTAPPVADEV